MILENEHEWGLHRGSRSALLAKIRWRVVSASIKKTTFKDLCHCPTNEWGEKKLAKQLNATWKNSCHFHPAISETLHSYSFDVFGSTYYFKLLTITTLQTFRACTSSKYFYSLEKKARNDEILRFFIRHRRKKNMWIKSSKSSYSLRVGIVLSKLYSLTVKKRQDFIQVLEIFRVVSIVQKLEPRW